MKVGDSVWVYPDNIKGVIVMEHVVEEKINHEKCINGRKVINKTTRNEYRICEVGLLHKDTGDIASTVKLPYLRIRPRIA